VAGRVFEALACPRPATIERVMVAVMAFPGGQPPYPNPHPPPPLAPFDALDKKVRLLGSVALVLAILKLLVFGYRILRSLATLLGVDDAPHHVPMRAIERGRDAYHRTIAIWDGLRALPYVAVGVVLVLIALRLQRGDTTALVSLRKWFFWSLGAVAISICVQAFAIIPATLKWEARAAEVVPSIPIFDLKEMMSTIVVATLVFGVVAGSLLRMVIPVVLYVWAGRLQAEQRG
jgi:hypothetical protein